MDCPAPGNRSGNYADDAKRDKVAVVCLGHNAPQPSLPIMCVLLKWAHQAAASWVLAQASEVFTLSEASCACASVSFGASACRA